MGRYKHLGSEMDIKLPLSVTKSSTVVFLHATPILKSLLHQMNKGIKYNLLSLSLSILFRIMQNSSTYA